MAGSNVMYPLGLAADPGMVAVDVAGRAVPRVMDADVTRGQAMVAA